MNAHWDSAKRIVIKIGSALLVDDKTGVVHRQWLANIVEEIAQLWRQNKQIILVSSGAVALGQRHLDFDRSRFLLEEKQASAAVGQICLAHAYHEAMAQHNISVAQMLLTLEDSENRRRYLNARNTLETLLRFRVIPIINENDTVATSEIRYGDNDRLSARVAQMAAADVLVLLSDIDGLYTSDPHFNPQAQLIPEVRELTPAIEAIGQGPASVCGTGGMKTKLAAARMVMSFGCRMVICQGLVDHPLGQLSRAGRCTWFLPGLSPKKARKNWLAQHLQPQGSLMVDGGAAEALKQGKSLLPAGVKRIEGDFRKGDLVRIITEQHQEIGRGLCNYPMHEARLIQGRRSDEIELLLGYRGSDEMIHRNNLVFI